MRITIATIGSHGDVRPYVALALGLEKAGHEVRIATIEDHGEFIKSFGIEFVAMGWEPPNFEKYLYKKRIFNIRTFNEIAYSSDDLKIENSMLAQLWQTCQGAEAIIFNGVAYPCYYIAEKLGVPCYFAPMQPHHETQDFHYVGMPPFKILGTTYNRLSYLVYDMIFWLHIRTTINKWRQATLNLPPLPIFAGLLTNLQQQKLPTIYSFSPLISKPSEWEEHVHLTGYWFLDTFKDWQPSTKLIDFLSEGLPPIYISKIWDNNQFTKEVLLEVSALTGRRIIVQSSEDEENDTEPTERLFLIKGLIPHEWLFPKVAVVVHHGGLGTIMSSLRAGIPSIAIPDPFLTDREFWANQLAKSGLGIDFELQDKEQLSAKKLAAAIQTAISDRAMQTRLLEISKKIAREDGIQQAIAAFDKHLPANKRLSLV
ncbi:MULTISPECIES: glycosyltransferase [Nostoc]|uniref:Glycosyltransferase family 1 protein n=1 Tax=Nostoc paludosum FACHB-159 TaxID=2692908 RepID=A0ABR8K508_9NOSO|nr:MULTISPECIES: glycosyltransferase [Nostoc]MBD2677467.1 glycosyltransferase family 1 protein [Nostoc sp. FACHB-857]MBD2734140.1 glycosyltransferase family 1 protein [Nostoc paludosum FACHB-159]